ncbi:exodeoxyribonuclease VII large subunit [Pseudovibrio sp. Tun.PSC04-5.I4]|uniref:exodeoxyribonuclease VII large subunit n=1 Tax=Pseudovibrio sp. Tun.PSC04-5.I4 TaxID=1798213 RepID=UPI000880B934|nr:exodeoxyribonuclease VII large subunit [Pseudovibrio sp. Tun.PSC04-5.I4]SDQ77519.1 Exodeoxyribonuclease VII large subunit [Pseudovibrio sp. Tun.PSC04-5.I4]
MSDKSNLVELTVSELSGAIKRTMEDSFDYVRVRGELGRISRPASGHIYLDLKDERAVLSGIIWKGNAVRLKVQPEQGLEVIATGKITTFPGQSKYQMVIDAMEPAGAGALMALLEERKKKLSAEGLFAEERKRPIPRMPMVVGVVTSPTGAVIRDILHRITDRFPLHVLVWPVRVQGGSCGAEVSAGIRGFNALERGGAIPRPDVIIVARGGGSVEDLWGFNEEEVVRAAAASDIPLISAVGHETDWSLLDLAADLRAPTPTGAAEFAVPVKAELAAVTDDLSRRLRTGLLRLVQTRRTELRAASAALPAARELLALPRQRFDMVAGRLERGLQVSTQIHRNTLTAASSGLRPTMLQRQVSQGRERLGVLTGRASQAFLNQMHRHRLRLNNSAGLLSSLSYERVIERGYTVVRDSDGLPVANAQAVQAGQALTLEMRGGVVGAVADGGGVTAAPAPVVPKVRAETAIVQPGAVEVGDATTSLDEHVAHAKAKQAAKPVRKKKPVADPGNQGSLF